jgi:hypothetical protein
MNTNFYTEAKSALIPDLFDIIKGYAKPDHRDINHYYNRTWERKSNKPAYETTVAVGDIFHTERGWTNEFYKVLRVNKKSFSGKLLKMKDFRVYDKLVYVRKVNYKKTTGDSVNFKYTSEKVKSDYNTIIPAHRANRIFVARVDEMYLEDLWEKSNKK